MIAPNSSRFFPLSVTLFLVVSFCIFAPASAGEVIIHTQTGILHATASASCPPEDDLLRDDLLTEDLVDFQDHVQVDDATSCGAATGCGSLTSRIDGTSITVDLSALSYLDGHRSCSGSSYFRIEMHLTSAVTYTMTASGSSSIDLEPGVNGLYFALVGVHEVGENQPDFLVSGEGVLGPGNVALEGSCSSSRAARSMGGGEWVFENGQAELIGSVTLTFSDADVVETENSSLGSLKARYR